MTESDVDLAFGALKEQRGFETRFYHVGAMQYPDAMPRGRYVFSLSLKVMQGRTLNAVNLWMPSCAVSTKFTPGFELRMAPSMSRRCISCRRGFDGWMRVQKPPAQSAACRWHWARLE